MTFPRVLGTGRMGDNPKAVLLGLEREPTDDELRAIHAALASGSSRVVPSRAGEWHEPNCPVAKDEFLPHDCGCVEPRTGAQPAAPAPRVDDDKANAFRGEVGNRLTPNHLIDNETPSSVPAARQELSAADAEDAGNFLASHYPHSTAAKFLLSAGKAGGAVVARQEAQPVAWLNPDDHSEFSTIGRVGWTPLYTAPEQEARDAARYRWLRAKCKGPNSGSKEKDDWWVGHWVKPGPVSRFPTADELDAAIDAAMAAQEPK